jgi:hypothetical protein
MSEVLEYNKKYLLGQVSALMVTESRMSRVISPLYRRQDLTYGHGSITLLVIREHLLVFFSSQKRKRQTGNRPKFAFT